MDKNAPSLNLPKFRRSTYGNSVETVENYKKTAEIGLFRPFSTVENSEVFNFFHNDTVENFFADGFLNMDFRSRKAKKTEGKRVL